MEMLWPSGAIHVKGFSNVGVVEVTEATNRLDGCQIQFAIFDDGVTNMNADDLTKYHSIWVSRVIGW